jgi:hypothetical protein
MPQRPRSHQLETESQQAFVSSLPSRWVYRPINPDYGLDGLVELFDESGKAQGDFFFVQLKSSDKSELSEALAIRIRRDTAEYYRSLALPVLVVVFHNPSKKLFAQWFKLESQEIEQAGETLTFRLAEEDYWDEQTISQIAGHVLKLRTALHLGQRELRMKEYYEEKRAIDLSAPAKEPIFNKPIPLLSNGDLIFHEVFGRGKLEEATENYLFAKFEDDEFLRKFYPGDAHEFFQLFKFVAPTFPNELSAALERFFPNYRVPQVEDISGDWATEADGHFPFMCTGDFVGSATEEFAFFAINRERRSYKILVLSELPNGTPLVYELEEGDGVPTRRYIKKVEKGRHSVSTVIWEHDGPKTLILERDALQVGTVESAACIYYWSTEKNCFLCQWISD